MLPTLNRGFSRISTDQFIQIDLFPGLANHSNRHTHGQNIALGGKMFVYHAGKGRFDLNGGFVGFNFGQYFAAINTFTFSDHPTHEHAFGHIKTQLGHGHNFSH